MNKNISVKVKKIVAESDTLKLMSDALEDFDGSCPCCGGDWNEGDFSRKALVGHRIGGDLADKIKSQKVPSKLLSFLMDRKLGVCFLCGNTCNFVSST